MKRKDAKRIKEWLELLSCDVDDDPSSVIRFLAYKIRRNGNHILEHNLIVDAAKVKAQTDEVVDLLLKAVGPGTPCKQRAGKICAWTKILAEDVDYDWACILNLLVERLKRFRKAYLLPDSVKTEIKETEGLLKRIIKDPYYEELRKEANIPKAKMSFDEKGRLLWDYSEEQTKAIRLLFKESHQAMARDLKTAFALLVNLFRWYGQECPPKSRRLLNRASDLICQNILGWWD